LDDLQDYSAFGSEWLAREEPFATLKILLDSSAYGYPPGGAAERKQWFSTNGVLLKEQVIGMATVAPADVVMKINKNHIDHYSGVSSQAFTTIEGAWDWLAPRLSKGIPNINTDALRARVLSHSQTMVSKLR